VGTKNRQKRLKMNFCGYKKWSFLVIFGQKKVGSGQKYLAKKLQNLSEFLWVHILVKKSGLLVTFKNKSGQPINPVISRVCGLFWPKTHVLLIL
jgi:hypothetical protein